MESTVQSAQTKAGHNGSLKPGVELLKNQDRSSGRPGFLDIDGVIHIYPVSARQWRKGVRDGIYPAPANLASKRKFWREADIIALAAAA
jgi:hypothetical protein